MSVFYLFRCRREWFILKILLFFMISMKVIAFSNQRFALSRVTPIRTSINDNDRSASEDSSNMNLGESVDNAKLKSYSFGEEESNKISIDPSRFVSYVSLAFVLAFGSNFLGVTTAFMTNTKPEVFRSLGLDQLYDIGGFRRYADQDDKYEYIFPSNWLVDQTVVMAGIRDRELPRDIREKKKSSVVRPDSAFGPANSDGKSNISVIKSTVMPGFSLRETLGEPKAAAERLLQNVIAPPSSGKVYRLVDAYEDRRDGKPAYVFEYTVRKPDVVGADGVTIPSTFFQHSISVIMSRGNELFTLTAVAPENKWEASKDALYESAKSFRINSPSLKEGLYLNVY